jgi:DNA repair protein RecN (Recombination protein N)
MLTGLSIRDIVLIDKLDLSFSEGLNVLTGETGAGKSILLDSLGLALGERADRNLVRQGTEAGSVTAVFSVSPSHPACLALSETGLDDGSGELVLRRQLLSDGRSKAWINDQAVGQALLQKTGKFLVEIHGQHDDRGLLEATAHRTLLDEFSNAQDTVKAVEVSHAALSQALVELAQLEQMISEGKVDEDYIRHAIEELAALDPQEGEEQTLADRRALMMHSENAVRELTDFLKTLQQNGGVDATVRGILRRMARLDGPLVDILASVMTKLDGAAEALAEANEELDRLLYDLDFDPSELEQIEERLFEMRRLARKHYCQPDELLQLKKEFDKKLESIDTGGDRLVDAQQNVAAARKVFYDKVQKLTKLRKASALELDSLVNSELSPLKLEKAIFRTSFIELPQEDWNAAGGEKVVFEVKTNAGSAFGPMVKVASGGELARFILALKVVLAKNSSVPVMVFDEVDRGIGGATASAVGERLKKLTKGSQVLVVTHSPQVAALGDIQFQIQKRDVGTQTRTTVMELSDNERTEEIARMLAGAEVTDAARAAALQLLDVSAGVAP